MGDGVLASVIGAHCRHDGSTDATSGFKASGPRAVLQLFAATYPAEYLGDTVEALVIGGAGGAEDPPVTRGDA